MRKHKLKSKTNTLDELIRFLVSVRDLEGGSMNVFLPRQITGRDTSNGYDVELCIDQISTELYSVGEEVDW